jgi:DNA repair protein RecN (Recombination protein N)
MLTNITIKNFTIIKEAEIDFYDGMGVITGETGAGKSVILDALDLVLGGRCDSSLIRDGDESAEITAIFDISHNALAQNWLQENEFACEKECFLRRVIKNDGRSKVFINGSMATSQLVRDLGSLLISILGQHESQLLLKPEKQLELLDNFAGNNQQCEEVANLYYSWSKAKKDAEELQNLAENFQGKLDFVNYQLKELDDLSLQDGEVLDLHREHTFLSNAENVIASCNNTLQVMSDEEAGNALSYLHRAKDELGQVKIEEEKFKTIFALLETAIINSEEATNELRSYLGSIELNQNRLAEIDERLHCIYDISRKHKVKPEELFFIYQKLKKQKEDLSALDDNLQKTQETINIFVNRFKKEADKLSDERRRAALKLGELITDKMQFLGMEGGKFAIVFHDYPSDSFNANGLETLEFYVSANPGMSMLPLRKVVSGGELSRISLAIKVVTVNKKNTTPALIFDEVDVGIGGKTAQIVGKLLSDLAQNSQVLCVTHLPQVAVNGKWHIKIEKITDGKSTHAIVKNLSKKDRVNEIARMLGGVDISVNTLATAKEMLEESKDY